MSCINFNHQWFYPVFMFLLQFLNLWNVSLLFFCPFSFHFWDILYLFNESWNKIRHFSIFNFTVFSFPWFPMFFLYLFHFLYIFIILLIQTEWEFRLMFTIFLFYQDLWLYLSPFCMNVCDQINPKLSVCRYLSIIFLCFYIISY